MKAFLRISLLVLSSILILQTGAHWIWFIKQREMNITLSTGQRWPVVTPLFMLATLMRPPQACDGQSAGTLAFAKPMPHGSGHNSRGTVMMTRIQEGNEVFIHTSDIQLLADEPIAQILAWSPTTLLTSGPPLVPQPPGG